MGAVQRGADGTLASLALMGLLKRHGRQVRHFWSRACLTNERGAANVTGRASRHLDSWLLTRDACRELLHHGMGRDDVAVIEGRYNSALSIGERNGGSLESLCGWFDVPRVAIIDISRLSTCALPERPENIDALILDGVTSLHHRATFETMFESLWGVPVVGSLDALPRLRGEWSNTSDPRVVPSEVCESLTSNLAKSAKVDLLLKLAERRACVDASQDLFAPSRSAEGATIATAFDEAFQGYFHDSLDMMEAWGARIVDFSPLHDEALPDGANVVLLGCGRADLFAAELAANHCMLTALRNHLRSGGRVYAEGGGMAYLCQHLESADGTRHSMLGAISAVARRASRTLPPRAMDLTLARTCWLGEADATVRGYLNANWVIEPTHALSSFVREAGHEQDIVGKYSAFGSRMQLNFVAAPDRIRGFLRPPIPSKEHSLAGARGW